MRSARFDCGYTWASSFNFDAEDTLTMAKLLVVDDDKNLRLLYEQELVEDGHEVTLAGSGVEALDYLKTHRPDLIILDISMPGMDGIEALGKILAKDKTMPVILNTAYSTYKDNFMTWSADAYVVKSGDLTELKSTIKDVLKTRGLLT
jgi:CheY-like chemotaxis protein